MKYPMLIRFLSGLTFLIFLCPFFQMCSDEDIFKKYKEVETVEYETSPAISEAPVNTVPEEPVFEPVKSIQAQRDEYTYNGYQLAATLFIDIDKSEFGISDIKDPGVYIFMCYTMAVIFSITVLVYAIRNNSRKVRFFGIYSLLTMIVPLGINYYIGGLEDINQIKYGYYLFIINVISIILLANKGNSKVITHAI